MALVRTTRPKKVIPLVSPHVNNLSLQSPADDDAPALCDVQRKVPTGCYVSLRNGCLPAHGIGVASAYGRPAKAALISVHCPSNLCSNCTSLRLWTASGQGPVVFALCSFRSDCNRRNRPVLLRDNLHHQQPFGNSSSVFYSTKPVSILPALQMQQFPMDFESSHKRDTVPDIRQYRLRRFEARIDQMASRLQESAGSLGIQGDPGWTGRNRTWLSVEESRQCCRGLMVGLSC